MELKAVVGFANMKRSSYCFQPLTGDLLYIAGSVVVVYSPTEKVQKDSSFLFNPKGNAFTHITIGSGGADIFLAESSPSANEIQHWKYDVSTDQYKKKYTFKTGFTQIEGLELSENQESLVVVGTTRDYQKKSKPTRKIELFGVSSRR